MDDYAVIFGLRVELRFFIATFVNNSSHVDSFTSVFEVFAIWS